MGWLAYGDDEVLRFHPEFQSAANDALAAVPAGTDLEWLHHPSTASGTVPDFALVNRGSGEWLLVVEIKRTRNAVFSARFQAQAKSYADANQAKFSAGRPIYFAITNLEVTLLSALNGMNPPSACVVQGGLVESGTFSSDPPAKHRAAFVGDIVKLLDRILTTTRESFEVVWPPLVELWLQHAATLEAASPALVPEPSSPAWAEVSAFFGQGTTQASARVTLLQGLLTDYFRGRLTGEADPRARKVPPHGGSRVDIARAIDALSLIDFEAVFDAGAANRFRSGGTASKRAMDTFARALSAVQPGIASLAERRQDYIALVEEALLAVHPVRDRARRGKVQTDPELAEVLATLTIKKPGSVLDPCCGDGPLLIGARDRLRALGETSQRATVLVSGVEVDPVSARLAAVRLAVRAGRTVDKKHQPSVRQGDMFASAPQLRAADHVVMNPPFRRYEDQGGLPVPDAVLDHYRTAITAAGYGNAPESLAWQPNLFHYYVEFVARTVKPGTRVGLVLDNKWFHNRTGASLRQVVLEHFQILAIVEYPHHAFFADWDVATSLLICERDDQPPGDNHVAFVRCRVDPRGVDLGALAAAMHGAKPWPTDWESRHEKQRELKPEEGWKARFASPLRVRLEALGLQPLRQLFRWSRRGSLEKEGGGTAVLGLPFNRAQYGPRRTGRVGNGFKTKEGAPLTKAENDRLRSAAAAIPNRFRGRVLKHADVPDSYELNAAAVEQDQMLEPPVLRRRQELFVHGRRSPWSTDHRAAVAEIRGEKHAGAYLAAVEALVNLTDAVLPDDLRFIDLREPYAGELIIPRKTRVGHRVHVNPFACDASQRQVRLSTNFVTYGECLAEDEDRALSRLDAARVIAAFLVSSFGQVQFELLGVNREGLLALEKAHLDRVLVLDPRDLSPQVRRRVLALLSALPFPVRTDTLSELQPRLDLDRAFANVLAPRAGMTVDALLNEVHNAVDEWVVTRQP